MKEYYIKQEDNLSRKQVKFPLTLTMSSSILAGLVAFSGTTEAVNAQEVDVDQEELESLYDQYNSIESVGEADEEAIEEETEVGTSLSEEEQEELDIVTSQLVDMIERAGGQDILARLDVEQLSYQDLDNIFEALLTQQIKETEDSEQNENEEDLSSIESEVTDEVEQTEASIEVEEESVLTADSSEDQTEDTAEERTEDDSEAEETLSKVTEVTEASSQNANEEVSSVEESENETSEERIEEEQETENSEETDELEEVEESEEVTESEEIEEPEEITESEEGETPKQEESKQETPKQEAPKQEQPKQETAKTEQTSQKAVTYTVRSGDTLNKIAREHGTTVNALVSLNNISDPNKISVGQVLAINSAAKGQTTSGSSNSSSNSSSPGNIGQAQTPAQFIEQIGPYAQRVAQEHGVYASVMIAQAALESGYGQSSLSLPPNHNLFGIKGQYNGQSVTVSTREYYSNTGWVTINDTFKRYPSYEESFQDNAGLLRRGTSWDPLYYSGAWVENTNSYRDATAWLQGRYATDPTYASKLNNLIQTYNLTRFDTNSGSGNSGGNTAPTTPSTPPSSGSGSSNGNGNTSTYTVVHGDTLSSIARRYNTTVSAIRSANGLSGDTIYVNQQLSIPEGSGSNGSSGSGSSENSQTTPTTPGQSSSQYTVVRGDTLYSIASRYNTSVSQLKSSNGLSSDTIYPGQRLQVPGSTTGSSTPSTSPSTGATTSYTIKAGDTLTRIAREFGTTVSALRQLNNLNSDLIFVGDTLRVSVSASNQPSAPSNPQTSTETERTGRYTVVAGDTLYGIARRYNTTVQKLKQDNRLSSDTIYVGQQLTVPGGTTQIEESSTTPVNNGTYTVVSGDTLFSIARRYNTSVSALRQLNNLTSDLILVNQRLIVPGGSPNSSTNQSGSSNSQTDSSSSSRGTYIVKAGNTLTSIARQFNTTIVQLKQLNGLTSDTIYVNQQLIVPGGETGQLEGGQITTPSSEANSATSTYTYTVVAGDTLTRIAREYGTTVSNLQSLNQLSNDRIYVGQQLTVSGNSSSTSNNQSNSSNTSDGSNTSVSTTNYTVVAGDSLSKIAREHETTVAQLKSMNQLASDLIFVGQVLKVQTSQVNQTSNQSSNTTNSSSADSNKTTGTYTVVSGDSLYKIAGEFNTSVASLKEINNLSTDIIRVGQQLTVPSEGATSATSNRSNSSSEQTQGTSSLEVKYTVKSKDTLSGIARTYNVTVAELRDWNQLENSDRIYVDQQLSVNVSSDSNRSENQVASSEQRYTVKSGDTLSQIARDLGTTVTQLKAENNLQSDLIFVGQNLTY